MPLNKWLFNQQALQEYLLCCCQETGGGLIDKPKKPRDFYHTCYGLSGLSIAQNALAEEFIVGDKELNRLVSLFNIKFIYGLLINFYLGSTSSFVQLNC